MAKVRKNYRFDELRQNAEKASANALEEVAALCVNTAKSLVLVETASLQGSIQYRGPVVRGSVVSIQWGSYNIDYAIHQEFGPSGAGRVWRYSPFLRPAKDKHYPSLGQIISRRMNG